ncbi:MAG: hypothetical protein QM644_14720 [Mobilitalea sp.]
MSTQLTIIATSLYKNKRLVTKVNRDKDFAKGDNVQAVVNEVERETNEYLAS